MEEVRIDEDRAVTLDGRAVELFWRGGGTMRWHVDHVGVEGRPRKDGGLDVHIGDRHGDDVRGGAHLEVPPEAVDSFLALFEKAKDARDG